MFACLQRSKQLKKRLVLDWPGYFQLIFKSLTNVKGRLWSEETHTITGNAWKEPLKRRPMPASSCVRSSLKDAFVFLKCVHSVRPQVCQFPARLPHCTHWSIPSFLRSWLWSCPGFVDKASMDFTLLSSPLGGDSFLWWAGIDFKIRMESFCCLSVNICGMGDREVFNLN